MSLRLRFLLSLLAVLALVVGPALFAVERVAALRDIVLELRGQAAQSTLAVGRLEAALLELDRHQRVFVATADPATAAAMHAATDQLAAAVSTLQLAGYGELLAEGGIQVERLAANAQQLEALVARRELERATSFLLTDAHPSLSAAREGVAGVAARIDLATSARVPEAQRSAVAAHRATTTALLVAVALAIVLSLATARVLTQPLERLRLAMAGVADGSFEAPAGLPYARRDEVGDLSRSFRTMTLRLEELDRLKAEFVGGISHDLKTPASVIAGYAELIQDEMGDVLEPRQAELLRSLAAQTATLQRRIDQLVEISRMEAGRLQLSLEEIDPGHFTEELQRAFQPEARLRSLRLVMMVDAATPPILGDPDVLRTDVLGNLMANAFEHTPAGGTITICVRPVAQGVCIEVTDTGAGIPANRLEGLFDRYYQRRGDGGGHGVGLAIAKAGAESHGGDIEVHSTVGAGTRVRVTLPAAPVASVAATPVLSGWPAV